MKRRIIVEDKIDKKIKVLEVEVRDEKHLQSQIKYPSITFKNKKKYTRKEKHRKDFEE